MCVKWPETSVGANERLGFMEAPQIAPANKASKATTPPMANPANIPCSLLPVVTFMITNIKKKVRITSSTKDCVSVPAGIVAPKKILDGNKNLTTTLAKQPPTNWLVI